MTLRRMTVVLAAVAAFSFQAVLGGGEVKPIPRPELQSLHTMIKPQPGENLFRQVDWLIDMQEAREKAAADGKPIFVWAGAGGPPVAAC